VVFLADLAGKPEGQVAQDVIRLRERLAKQGR
jgi:hypothetical protein